MSESVLREQFLATENQTSVSVGRANTYVFLWKGFECIVRAKSFENKDTKAVLFKVLDFPQPSKTLDFVKIIFSSYQNATMAKDTFVVSMLDGPGNVIEKVSYKDAVIKSLEFDGLNYGAPNNVSATLVFQYESKKYYYNNNGDSDKRAIGTRGADSRHLESNGG